MKSIYGIVITSLLLVGPSCKQPSNEALETSALSEGGSSGAWLNLAEFYRANAPASKLYIFKFGSPSCIPCKKLGLHLPKIVKRVDSSRFILVDLDIYDKDFKQQQYHRDVQNDVLDLIMSENPKINAWYQKNRNRLPVPIVVVTNHELKPLMFIDSFDYENLEKTYKEYENKLRSVLPNNS